MKDEPQDETIPKATHLKRLEAKNGRIAQLEEQLAASKGLAKDLEGRLADAPDVAKMERRISKLIDARDAATEALDAHRAASETREAMMAAGITDTEDMDLVRWRYDRLDADGRPALSEWLTNEARADRHLAGLFNGPPQETAQDAPQEAPGQPNGNRQPRALPDAQKGVKGTGTAPPGALSREAIMAMPISERVKPENRERIMAILRDR